MNIALVQVDTTEYTSISFHMHNPETHNNLGMSRCAKYGNVEWPLWSNMESKNGAQMVTRSHKWSLGGVQGVPGENLWSQHKIGGVPRSQKGPNVVPE